MGLLDIFGGDTSQLAGSAGLLSPQDKLMALFQGLSHAGINMAQPGLGKGQALAMGLGGLGQGMAQGQQQAVQQRLFLQKLMDQQQQKKAQDDYLAAHPEHAALARAVGPEAFKTMLDRTIPKPAEVPFGFEKGPNGVTQTPGANNAMAALEAAKAAARTGAERGAQNAVPLITDQPEFKARVAGAETGARQAAEMPYVGPRAAAEAGARSAVDLRYAQPLAQQRAAGTLAGEMQPIQTPTGPMPGAQALAQARNVPPAGQAVINESKLRDDFNGLPTVKAYREVVPIYQSMQDASARDTRASDLNLVYGLAKIMDPNSVVREGEMVMVTNTSSLPDWIIGKIKAVNGGERLQPDTRKALMEEAGSRVDSYKQAHDHYAAQFGRMATAVGGRPENVVLDVPAPKRAPALPPVGPEGAILTGMNGEQKIVRGGKWVDLK